MTEKVPQIVNETYQYVTEVPRKIVEKVKTLVPETYSYIERLVEKIPKTRTEFVEEIRNVEKTVYRSVAVKK